MNARAYETKRASAFANARKSVQAQLEFERPTSKQKGVERKEILLGSQNSARHLSYKQGRSAAPKTHKTT